jgi:hypothetical protein
MKELPNLSSKVETTPKKYKPKKMAEKILVYIYIVSPPIYFPLDSS